MADLEKVIELLPTPAVVEEPRFEVILEAHKQDFLARLRAETGDDNPYPAINLESDPVNKALQTSAYRELLLRYRINNAARANLLAYAEDSDLDHLGAFYGVMRLDGESDGDYRTRIIARLKGSSAAGSPHWYRFHALSAHSAVRDAKAYGLGQGAVRVALLIDPTADKEVVVEAVEAMVTSDSVRALNDDVSVQEATLFETAIEATVRLYPDTPADVFVGLQTRLQTALDEAFALGRDLTRTWLIAQLNREGVYSVDLVTPNADVIVASDEAVLVTGITLHVGERGY